MCRLTYGGRVFEIEGAIQVLMSGVTALGAGHEFGAIVHAATSEEPAPRYRWQTGPPDGGEIIRIADYRERNRDTWKTQVS